MLRGTASGLEIVLEGDSFDAAWQGVARRLAERPDFYRGSRATAIVEVAPPAGATFADFLEAVRAHGIDLRGVYGDAETEALALAHGAAYLGVSPRAKTPRLAVLQRAPRVAEAAPLTDGARSLDADFAGARADFVQRRARIVAARERSATPSAAGRSALSVTVRGGPAAHGAPSAAPATLYHRGHLRGGQSLRHAGPIVVIGDVNPGAELTAGGDILVFGALRGTAHAGAQGDATARVIALELQPTQLRIATAIAAGAEATRRSRGGLQPEVAFVDAERGGIAIAAYDDPRVPA